jgi:GNAT superfamily N-acetyltransferase
VTGADPLAIRRVEPGDVDALLALSGSVGWAHERGDWSSVLGSGVVLGHRDPSGAIVSSTAVFPYGPALAAIGMVLVMPAWQGRGLAAALMRHALEVLQPPVPAHVLIATPQGFPLYRRLGFVTVGHVRRLSVSAPSWPAGGNRVVSLTAQDVVPLTARDVEAIGACDAEATGVDRRRMLAARLDQGGGVAIRDRAGALAGFGLRTAMREAVVIGPVVAPDAPSAATLVGALAAGHDGPVRIDVPSEQEAFQARLVALGFTSADEAPVMLIGADRLPGRRERVFAVANRAFC